MDSKQLIDSLTAHIALYHSSSSLSTSQSQPPSANPRASILRWFASLTVHQRQAYLTIVDAKFTEILLQMQRKIRQNGHGFFIILPDLPSRDRPSLPSLCFRKSRGLLARASASDELERSVSRAVRMFGSREGERVEECECSVSVIDTVTVSEEFVRDLDRFVEVMDRVSNGGFLRGEDAALGSSWEELPWLKAKGYYSMEAFVANKLELALRLAWLNCNGGKKKGAKLKEKTSAAGVAANVYWRKKGCLDWWTGLDLSVRKKVLRMSLGKAAKCLTNEILKGENSTLDDDAWLYRSEQPLICNTNLSWRKPILTLSGNDAEFGMAVIHAPVCRKPTYSVKILNSLVILQGISAMILSFPDSECEEKLFFSTLDSVCTISDSISRKLRGLLIFVSLDCTKLELLGEGNPSQKKSKEKTGVINRKRKAKNRNKNKLKSSCISSATGFSVPKPLEEQGCQIPYREDADVMEANGMASMLEGKHLHGELLSGVEMEHAKGLVNRKDAKGLVDRKDSKELVDGKVQNFGKKSKKEDIRRKKSGLKGSSAIEHSGTEIFQATTHFATCHSEVAESSCLADASTVLPNAISYAGETENLTRNSSSCNSTNELNMENDTKVVRNFGRDSAVGTVEDNCHIGSGCSHLLNREVRSQIVTSGKETRGRTLNPYTASPVNPETEFDDLPSNMEHRNQTSLPLSDSTSESKAIKVEATETKEENLQNLKKKSGNYYTYGPCSSGCTSYEWPSVAPVHFPSVNSQHLPVATDRLHLEVGYDWRHQFHQSFVSTGHQGINHSVEGSGCNRIMSMPMSLDWPPMVRSVSRLTPSMTFNYDSGFIPRVQSSYRHGLTAQGLQLNGTTIEDEKKYYGDLMDSCDLTNTPEPTDEIESHWISEEEFEVHAFSGRDYNQYFGGGVMYWNVSDHPGTGFSRPPSLSSEDSSWAWREAELNRTVDDMVNGLTSPPAAPFCSPFDSLGPGHQTLGYVLPGNDVSGKVLHSSSTMTDVGSEDNVSGSFSNPSGSLIEGQNGDSLPYPILRPIIVPKMSRKGSRSEFKLSNGHKSPCIPPSRREQPRIKRAPSPVMLCAPRAPRPPPPSPVGESRKQRGFPTVRSGSSSPRHWGMRNWFLDGKNSDEARLCVDGPEVIWPSWRNKSLSATTMIQPLPDALLQDHLIAMSQLALEHEHPDVALPLQPPDLLSCPAHKMALPLMHGLLHDEIDSFCKQVAVENFIRKPYVNWAVKRVARSLQVLWPRSRTNVFGSNATGLALPTSDVDLVVSLPPVRNLEPIKEAGILEGRNGIKETCLQHAARYLANQEWVKNDSVKTVENTAIPIIMLMAEVHPDLISSTGDASDVQTPNEKSTQMIGEHCTVIHTDTVGSESSSLPKCSKMRTENAMDVKSIRLDISFKSSSHTGLQTTELVKELTEQFPAATPLALVLKKFLADRSLDQSYSGGLSSYCLVLLITRFLQHEHHLGRPINQNLGSLLMDFLYFFGNVFDPRQMRISVQGSGVYLNRERGYSIDPIHIDDPLFPTNNIGRNCFRIHQCIKAFADAYSALENELTCFSSSGDSCTRPPYRLLPRIIPSIDHVIL